METATSLPQVVGLSIGQIGGEGVGLSVHLEFERPHCAVCGREHELVTEAGVDEVAVCGSCYRSDRHFLHGPVENSVLVSPYSQEQLDAKLREKPTVFGPDHPLRPEIDELIAEEIEQGFRERGARS